ncbi:hypothetical protein BT96DRAFT_984382 [Gymnopus androsaceus JB14]|uniref:Uncharacterized protein n=1 Tax=Gymnopus androsaceus JB14 TaxID=1447944 RepID=A0A6A4IML5_9AGAR|nr:hypothetical protein BT96DRAFT_984382 [Gymnopus androsaceus JB14]
MSQALAAESIAIEVERALGVRHGARRSWRSRGREPARQSERNTSLRNEDAVRNDDPAPPYSPTPSSTTAGAGKGLSSSLGRSSGKRTGIARLIVLASQELERKEVAVEKDRERRRGRERERERERLKEKQAPEEKEKTRVKDRDRRSEQDAVGISSFSGVSRSGRKGRSLDLGIGLSWAGTKVPESVLLPGVRVLAFYAGRERAVDEFGVEDRSKVGKDVANIFKKALDPEGYSAFKKCEPSTPIEIPFDGPNGIIERTQKLLDKRSELTEESKQKVIDRLVKIVLQNA